MAERGRVAAQPQVVRAERGGLIGDGDQLFRPARWPPLA
jgi:hypothetical protein